MDWLKDVLLDILVTIFIVTAVFVSDPWMVWIIWIYTGIMLITKTVVFFGDNFLRLADKAITSAPEWVPHLLYAINTTALLAFQWWYSGVAWALIWAFSYGAQRKLEARKGNR